MDSKGSLCLSFFTLWVHSDHFRAVGRGGGGGGVVILLLLPLVRRILLVLLGLFLCGGEQLRE